MEKVIHVKTQAEWDFVTEKLGYKWSKNWFTEYKDKSVIYCNATLRSNLDSTKGKIVISFEDWCKENNYTFTKTYTKDDFVVDKWYTCSCNSNYYQFDGYLTTDKFGSKAVINPTKISHANAKSGYTKRISHEACLEYFSPDNLVDEFLIQQYLSKDIEPIELPIVGEVYRVDDVSGFWLIGKITDNTLTPFTGKAQQNNKATFINKNKEFYKNGEWCYYAKNRSYKLATPEEKEWLEHCIEIDKYISFEDFISKDKVDSKWIPKVGDWVVITKSDKNWGKGSTAMDKYVDKCVQIETVSPYESSKRIKFKDDGNWDWVYSDGHFRQATTLEIVKATNEPMYSGKNVGTPVDMKDCTKLGEILIDIPYLPESIRYSDVLKSLGSTKEIPLNLPKEKVQLKPLLNIKLEQVKLINF